MDDLDFIEKTRNIKLPELYRAFYEKCRKKFPQKLSGTDLFEVKEFNEWAEVLLKENGVENFLDKKDFVFMFHQGYIFWFFKADGTLDPTVFRYSESDRVKEELKTLSEFVKEFE